MLSLEPISREYEISGLTKQQVEMYDLAWKHNKDGLGFAGMCDLWYREISPHITLKQIQIVWQRMIEFSFFHTNIYIRMAENGYSGVYDYVPRI